MVCLTGNFLLDGNCKKCNDQCKECTKQSECSLCTENSNRKLPTCDCIDGFFSQKNDPNGACKACV